MFDNPDNEEKYTGRFMEISKKNILFFIILLFADIFSMFPESLPEYLNGIAYYYMNMENYYEATF